ncbi:MAG TPA: uroporphyrinogen decarboxylase family protein [Candidatus Ratteibacteria bacterium]|nr:uroporphyrinogen decarboxylase family protein [bacterium]HQL65034.1 uroporphyrinogen decarboxylase family protein [bacterium]HRS07146.1 uroporphyrinogen decarboxylase family protein [Candidatus Ratteibacteria bacterium]HRV05244.1 uroporphyrinogen decarboxylase family protein [Candidatus Ratteibacteria bacterium]
MNSKERSQAVLNHQNFDRYPLFDILTNDAAIEYYSGKKLTIENAKQVVHEALDNMVDATRWIIIYPQKEEKLIAEDGTIIEQKRWTAWYHRRFVLTLEDVEKDIRHDIDYFSNPENIQKDADDLDNRIEEVAKIRQEFKNMFLFGNYMIKTGLQLYTGIGLELFSYFINDFPELFDLYMNEGTEFKVKVINRAKKLQEFSAIFDCEDIASKNGPLFSPLIMKKYFYLHLEQIIDAYHKNNIKVIFHTDGNVMPILDELVATGIDGLNPLEVIAGMNLREIRKKHKNLVMIGGIDCSHLLPYGTVDDVREATKQAIYDAGPWYFPGSSTELHNSIPLDNIKAMVDTIRESKL